MESKTVSELDEMIRDEVPGEYNLNIYPGPSPGEWFVVPSTGGYLPEELRMQIARVRHRLSQRFELQATG